MKYTKYTRPFLCLLFLCLLGMGSAYAQPTIHSAGTSTDIATALPTGYINCATIDYSPNCSGGYPGCSGTPQLIAITSETGGTVSVDVEDGVSAPVTFSFSGYAADVVLGNNISTTTNYRMGIVYTVPANILCGTYYDVYLKIYDVTGVGGGSLACSLTNTILVSSGSGDANAIAHIDIIAEYAVLTIGGLPRCNEFVISWVEPDPYFTYLNMGQNNCVTPPNPAQNNDYGVNLYWSSFSNPSTFTHVPRPTNNPAIYADVAAVQRKVNGVTYPTAYYTYIDNTNAWYQDEYPFLLGNSPSPNFLANNMMESPRIDAIDNFNFNNDPNAQPSAPPSGNFDWVAVNSTSGGMVIEQPGYARGWSLPSSTTLGGFTPSYNDYFPVITCGEVVAQGYVAGFYHPDGFNSFITDPGLPWAFAGYTAASPANYYTVNYNATGSTDILTAISSTCNNDGNSFYSSGPSIPYPVAPLVLACWNDGTVWFKLTPNSTLWKHNTGVNTANAANKWLATPNPATNYMKLCAPANAEKAAYKICDITGRELLLADIKDNIEPVDISMLAIGVYLLHIYEAGKEVKTLKIVKE